MTKLRLRADGTDDLEIIAAAVQDAIFKVGEARFDSSRRFFTLRLSRYTHETGAFRVESGLRFDGVLNVRAQGVDLAKPDAFAVILGLDFEATDLPAGLLNLKLAGGGTIQVYVEAIDMTLADVGELRATKKIPKHD
jgi:hypothetical protein